MINEIKPEYPDVFPEKMEEGVLYISKKFKIASHKCCCGCGGDTVTPLEGSEWTLIEENDEVSLSPSIGNFNFKCNSHYYIKKNKVEWL